jgi:hypothetical protein
MGRLGTEGQRETLVRHADRYVIERPLGAGGMTVIG